MSQYTSQIKTQPSIPPASHPLTLIRVYLTSLAKTDYFGNKLQIWEYFRNKLQGTMQHYMVIRRRGLTLAGMWDSSVLTEFEEEQWDPVFVSDPDTRRFLDSGELDIYRTNRANLEQWSKETKNANKHYAFTLTRGVSKPNKKSLNHVNTWILLIIRRKHTGMRLNTAMLN